MKASSSQNPTSSRFSESESSKPDYVIGIGASAGGLDAIQQFFKNMPSDSGMAFVVVQHLSPDYKSMMAELLSKHTSMPVTQASSGMCLEPDRVYLIPPKKNLTLKDGHLFLPEQDHSHGLNLPIDIFFRSLAEAEENKAVAIVLSGTGSDGTRGIRNIKENGGMIMVQDEDSAQFDGMPRSAINTGLADYVLPPDKMPDALLKFVRHPFIDPRKQEHPIETETESMSRLLDVVASKTSVDFQYYKKNTVIRRIERRMGIVQSRTVSDYLEYLLRNTDEMDSLFRDLLIGVTKFFRDSFMFEVVNREVVPELFRLARERKSHEVRVWVPGCSTGEEAYSIAMLLHDYRDRNNLSCDIKVFATDIDRRALELAGAGVYPDSIAADVDVRLLSKYLDKRTSTFRVKQCIRELVVFAIQNLVKDPPFTRIDLVSCRNLLIYFQPVLQKKALSIFNYALNTEGFLVLGTSESVGEMSGAFMDLDSKSRIYQHTEVGGAPLKDPIVFSPSGHNLMERIGRPAAGGTDFPVPHTYESREAYYHALLSKVSKAVLVLNSDRELVQTFGDASKYLHFPMGNVSLDILTMLPRPLSLVVSSGIHRCQKQKAAAVYNNVQYSKNDDTQVVGVYVDFIELDDKKIFFTIMIDELPVREMRVDCKDTQVDFFNQRITELEQEVQFSRENLQATVEELQTANEELQASNEELLAANEELQSTNEELQSVNEELNTVNSEYQAKVMELSILNNDMTNLMQSTDIATIFLDSRMRIRKFTPEVTRETNILDQDIGRPLTDLTNPVLDELPGDVAKVIAGAASTQRVVRSGSRWFLMRALPFRNEHGVMDGVVVTLVNITEQKQNELALEQRNKLLINVLENSNMAQLMVNGQGMVLFSNTSARTLLGWEQQAPFTDYLTAGKCVFKDLEGTPLTELYNPLADALTQKKPITRWVVRCVRGDGTEDMFNFMGSPSFDAYGEVETVVFTIQDVEWDRYMTGAESGLEHRDG